MRRIQLIEIHEQAWLPAFLRDAVTDDLQVILDIAKPYRCVLGGIAAALRAAGTGQVVDLCSGAGGPWIWLRQALEENGSGPLEVWLTDKYPNAAAFERLTGTSQGKIRGCAKPVDATQVPTELRGFRTFFSSFHHFPPPQARAILRDAAEQGQGIGIFEAPGRYALTILLVFLIPIADSAVVPFLRPFQWRRLIWNLLLPVVPAVLFLDGIVSCLRVYSPAELAELTAGISADGYEWEFGVERRGRWSLPVTYLIGVPGKPRT